MDARRNPPAAASLGRRFVAPLLRSLLRRPPGEIARRSAGFALRQPEDRERLDRLGAAFIAGYNAMLRDAPLRDIAAEGGAVAARERPFFFEGAAMGYLPRGWLDGRASARHAQADLLGMHPAYLYLYYVGLGFWHALRYPRRPESIEAMRDHLDPVLLPLCYDGFGFKVGFFDALRRPEARRVLERCPPGRRAAAEQGFGRALFFVHRDDEPAFRRAADAMEGRHRLDLETGRSLALAFSGVDRPAAMAAHVAAAGDVSLRRARLTGVTWALAARAMTDAGYFARCVDDAPPDWKPLMRDLPALCEAARGGARDYADWQVRTADAALAAWSCRGA